MCISTMWHLTTCHNCIKMDTFDARFSNSSSCHFPGSIIAYLFIKILYFYATVGVGIFPKEILLTCRNVLVNYYVPRQFDIIKSE